MHNVAKAVVRPVLESADMGVGTTKTTEGGAATPRPENHTPTNAIASTEMDSGVETLAVENRAYEAVSTTTSSPTSA